MDSKSLLLLLEEVEINIDNCRKGIAESENQYHDSLKLITDLGLRSSLMELHIIHIERETTALSEMKTLFDQVKDQVARQNKSN